MYADYEYYRNEYLMGKEATISAEEFPYWEKQAERKIDMYTQGRLRGMTAIIDEVKACVCEMAEFLYTADKMEKLSEQSGSSGPLTSFSNDGQSGSFDVSQSEYFGDGKAKKVIGIIKEYLWNTGLLYGGILLC